MTVDACFIPHPMSISLYYLSTSELIRVSLTLRQGRPILVHAARTLETLRQRSSVKSEGMVTRYPKARREALEIRVDPRWGTQGIGGHFGQSRYVSGDACLPCAYGSQIRYCATHLRDSSILALG